MKINLTKIEVEDIAGKKVKVDFSKDVANTIYNTTKDIGLLEVSRALYGKGEVEVDDKTFGIIKEVIEQNFFAFAKEGLNKYFNSLKK